MNTDPISPSETLIPLQTKNSLPASQEFHTARRRADKILDTTTYRIFKARQFLNYNQYNHYKTIRNLLSIVQPLIEELTALADTLEQHNPPHDQQH